MSDTGYVAGLVTGFLFGVCAAAHVLWESPETNRAVDESERYEIREL